MTHRRGSTPALVPLTVRFPSTLSQCKECGFNSPDDRFLLPMSLRVRQAGRCERLPGRLVCAEQAESFSQQVCPPRRKAHTAPGLFDYAPGLAISVRRHYHRPAVEDTTTTLRFLCATGWFKTGSSQCYVRELDQ
jgi:hypothetical protein